ncbi:multicopper oxidase family protein [Elioraea rosea]|uniref:multicopper oxidase family protein n=1 Tax=Elioraea rosea TaxID=2492390 RepID=UPI0011834A1C|nr:multicopper oxidase domain-containing protein [Elioraea rosea]
MPATGNAPGRVGATRFHFRDEPDATDRAGTSGLVLPLFAPELSDPPIPPPPAARNLPAPPEAVRVVLPVAGSLQAAAAIALAAASITPPDSVPPTPTSDAEPGPALLRVATMDDLFRAALPVPETIDATNGGTLVLQMRETQQWLGLTDELGDRLMTTVWGYGTGNHASYPGPTILAQEGVTLRIHWQNMLPDEHLLPVDESIAHAMGMRGGIPAVTHLHGGHSDSASDGIPEAWFTAHHKETGPDYATRVYTYDNSQDAATLWYHDHALGLTRLNTYAGLAGFYILIDENEQALVAEGYLPGREFQLGLAIQDRAFTTDGRLYLPGAHPDDPLPGTGETVRDLLPDDYEALGGGFPTTVPEFFGDHILVNGMAWPVFEADPGAYRLHLLNGSDSRFYLLRFDNPLVEAKLVGVDGGLLQRAVSIMDGDGVQEAGEEILLAPGDRVELVVDFGADALRGQSVTLLNGGPAFEPFKGLLADGALAGGAEAATQSMPVGNVMQFRIGAEDVLANTAGVLADAANARALVRETDWAMKDLLGATPDRVRQLGLFEGEDEYGRILPSLGLAEEVPDIDGELQGFGALAYHDPATEVVRLGDVELWRIHNFTEDAHPLHLHLVQFQVVEKRGFSFADADEDGTPDDVTSDGVVDWRDLTYGAAQPVRPEETGFQDTVWIAPDEVLEIIAHFDKPGEYVWHCHVLSHEDHDMMRPLLVAESLI